MSTHNQTKDEWVYENRLRLLEEYRAFAEETNTALRWGEWVDEAWETMKNKALD